MSDWLIDKFSELDEQAKGACFGLENIYRWKAGKPFKEMQWEGAWEDLRIAQKISDGGANKGQMSPRKIMRAHTISKIELEDLTGLILSHNIGNKKISNKFIFDRSDK